MSADGREQITPIAETDARTRRHEPIPLDGETIGRMMAPAAEGRRVAAAEPLAGGYINTNYRVRLEGLDEPLVLRVYTRDPAACRKEQEVHALVHGRVPVPEVLFADPDAEQPYLITRWVEGVKLEDLLARASEEDADAAGVEAGRVLAGISSYQFPQTGFFGPGLEVTQPLGEGLSWFAPYLEELLFRGPAGERLGQETARRVWELIVGSADLLEAVPQTCSLVHADYRAWNLLMRLVQGAWKVAGVLDWEFAFCGPPMLDIGGMLRHSDSLPTAFEPAFARGFAERGGLLPREWKRTAKLLDLVNLCQFLSMPNDNDWRVETGRYRVHATLKWWKG